MKQTQILWWVILWLLLIILWTGTYFYPHLSMMYRNWNMWWMWHMMDNTNDNAMREHCKTMPEMKWCEKYAAWNTWTLPTSELFTLSQTGFTDLKPTEIVELKDGDTYTIDITKVKKEIGNATLDMLAYNWQIPWPIIKVAQNSKVKITVVNKVQEIETTLHSHGIRLKDDFDGVTKDMWGKQDPIKYGKSFTYEIEFKDAGIYWYHPHIREDIQQELGLYGNYLVTPTDKAYYNKVDQEETLILDDIALEDEKVKPFYKDFSNYILMGRYGNTMLINGETSYTHKMKYNTVSRLYLTNASNTRVYNIHIPWVKIKVVWSDMSKYEKEFFTDSLVIWPAERYIVEILPVQENGTIGSGEYEIQNVTPDETYVLGKIQVTDIPTFGPNEKYTVDAKLLQPSFFTLQENEDVKKDIDTYRTYFEKSPDKTVTLDIGHKGMWGGMMGMMGNMGHGDPIEWEDNMPGMNKNSNSVNMEWKIIEDSTGKENMNIDWTFNTWDVVKIRIKNKKEWMHPMQHPLHLHGQRFLVVDANGKKSDNLVWKDTVLVKTWEYVDILVDMSNPWEWMAHCHIAEHLHAGMMLHFSVKE